MSHQITIKTLNLKADFLITTDTNKVMDEDEHSEGEEDMQFEEEYSDNSHTSDSHEDEMEWQHRPQPPQRSRLDATSSIMLQTSINYW